MQTYRATFTLSSPYLTPWQADTLFGHLCWALARREGSEAVTRLLDRCQAGDPPLLLSDGLPPDRFPRPLLPPPLLPAAALSEQMAVVRRGKMLRESRWLSGQQFAHALQDQMPDIRSLPTAEADLTEQPFSTLHNQINRLTGTTGGQEDAGNLFPLSGEVAAVRVVFVRVARDLDFDWQALFHEVARTGFGKRKSVGYGAIRHLEITSFSGFGEPEDADGFVSLSSFVPAASDPTDGYWRTDVKYGKLGEERALEENPFKRPLVRLLPGAVFRTDGPPRLFYGRMIEGIAPALPDVAQYGLAFAVGLRMPAYTDKGDGSAL